MGTELQFCKMKKGRVKLHNNETVLMPLNRIFKNGQVGKFYVMYILLPFFKEVLMTGNFIFSFKMVIRKMYLKRTNLL